MCLRASAKSSWGVLNWHSDIHITSFEGRNVAAELHEIYKLQSPTKKVKQYYSSEQISKPFSKHKVSHTLDVAGSKHLKIVAIKGSLANQKTKRSCCWTFTIIHKVVWIGSITLEFSLHNLIIHVCICYHRSASCCLEPVFNVFAAFKIMICAFLALCEFLKWPVLTCRWASSWERARGPAFISIRPVITHKQLLDANTHTHTYTSAVYQHALFRIRLHLKPLCSLFAWLLCPLAAMLPDSSYLYLHFLVTWTVCHSQLKQICMVGLWEINCVILLLLSF